MIVVAEGPTGAGKTTWCRRHYADATIGEHPPSREVEESLVLKRKHVLWVEANCRRWGEALRTEKRIGLAVCDTDPFKLHYTWSLWRLGRVGRDEWELAAEVSRAAFKKRRLGIADLTLIEIPAPEELRRRREHDHANAGRRRGMFQLHHQLAAPLREWYEAIERLDQRRVRWGLPEDGVIDPLPLRRTARSGRRLFDQLLAELPGVTAAGTIAE